MILMNKKESGGRQGNTASDKADPAAAARQNREFQPDDEAEIVKQLTQKHYELSKELAEGIGKLKELAQEMERYVCKAEGKYRD